MGIATSIGFGILQINGGLNTAYGVPDHTISHLIIVFIFIRTLPSLFNYRIKERNQVVKYFKLVINTPRHDLCFHYGADSVYFKYIYIRIR